MFDGLNSFIVDVKREIVFNIFQIKQKSQLKLKKYSHKKYLFLKYALLIFNLFIVKIKCNNSYLTFFIFFIIIINSY